MMEQITSQLTGLKSRWKVFAVSGGLVFAMVILPYLGVKVPSLISPMPKKADVFDKVEPKLDQKVNNFQIHRSSGLVTTVGASGDYDGASAYAVMDFSNGNILYQKNLSQKIPIASLTKIMTAVVALDLASPDEQFTVSQKAADQIPTKIGVVPGEKMTLQELLDASLLTSANDAVQAIADGVDAKYGEPVFVRAMNAKARFLGLKDSYFTNPQGLDDGSPYSSAEDLAVLTHYALSNYPQIYQTVRKDYIFLPQSATHKQFDLYNWNGLLDVYPGVMGVKIGNTDAAGYTTIVLSKRDNDQVMVVLLGAPGVLERDMWASELLDLGFSNFNIAPANITEAQLKDKYATWKYFN